MKKLHLFILLLMMPFGLIQAVSYCATSSWGYAGTSVTGGTGKSVTIVSSSSALKTAITKGNAIIIITKDIEVTTHISSSASNYTLMALPGVKLISNVQNKSNSGILYLKGSNIILRNITFEGPGAYDCDGWDNLCLDGAKNVWVDHCDFQDGCDGNFDNKGRTDSITISWCRFHYLKTPKAGGSGGTDDHRFTNLIGSSSSDKPSDGTYNITWAYCWWDEGCVERMTRCRNCELHFLNCYWNSSVANYYVGPEGAKCYFEGCTFAGKANTSSKIFKSYGGTNACKFVNCAGNLPSNSGSVSAPSYTYDKLSAANAKTAVTNSTCGAGATLTVTSAGAVSSSCDGGSTPVTPDPDPEPTDTTSTDPSSSTTDLTWNFSDTQFSSITDTIVTSTTIDGLTIAANSAKPVVIVKSAKVYGDYYSFTHVLKMGGTMASNARYLSFAVTGPCELEFYCMSASNSATRSANLCGGNTTNVLNTFTEITGDTINKLTYSYTGGATTLYIGSAGSGLNFYGIKVTYSSSTDPVEPEVEETPTVIVPNNASQTVFEGEAITDIVFEGSGTTASIAVNNLPDGLTSSINGLTVTISGTPTTSGSYVVVVTNKSGETYEDGGYITVNEKQEVVVEVTDTVMTSTWWNISDDDFNSLGEITSNTVVRQLHILANEDEKVVVDANNKTIDDISFTNRLKFGGEGSEEARQLWFDVKGNCTVDVYLMSSNSSTARTLNVATGIFSNIVTTMAAETSIAKKTYEYEGDATKIMLYPDGGVNLYGIRLTYAGETPADTTVTPVEPDTVITPDDPVDPVTPTTSDAIYYWQMSGTSAPATGDELTAQGGSLTIGVKTGKTDVFSVESTGYITSVSDEMKAKDGKGLKAGSSNIYAVATLNSGSFLAGDTIYICGYKNWKVSTDNTLEGDLIESITTGEDKYNYAVGYAILTKDAAELYFSRAEGTSTAMSAIKVCRNTSSAPVAPTGLENTYIHNGKTYNILGQEVDSTYHGIVIRNGVKYIQK